MTKLIFSDENKAEIKKMFSDLWDGVQQDDVNAEKVRYDDALEKWSEWAKAINDGLPFESDGEKKFSWVRSEKGDDYLPNALLTSIKGCGGISQGSATHYMVYRHNNNEKTNVLKKNKYYNGYEEDRKKRYNDKNTDAKNSYDKKIEPLLKDIIEVKNVNDVVKIEKSQNYKDFSGIQLLRKMIILESLRLENNTPDGNTKEPVHSELNNTFLWIYSHDDLSNLIELLGGNWNYKKAPGDDDVTFFEANSQAYEILKNIYIDLKKEKTKETEKTTETESDLSIEDICKLYILVTKLLYRKVDDFYMSFDDVNVILNGAPGTGKTYTVSESIRYLNSINKDLYKDVKMIQFHPSYTYQDFIEGIKPMGIDKGNLKLQIVNGSFKEFCIRVRQENEKKWSELGLNKPKNKEKCPNKDKPETLKAWPHYYFVVDEINRGNLSNIFGETFTLLEYRDYDFSGSNGIYNYNPQSENSLSSLVDTTTANVIKELIKSAPANSDGLFYKKIVKGDDFEVKFGIPFNIHFIGMMNDVDRSIDSFDLAFRRRFRWEPKYCDYSVIYKELIDYRTGEEWLGSVEEYVQSCMRLNYYITGVKPTKIEEVDDINNSDLKSLQYGRIYEIGQGYFLKIKNLIKRNNELSSSIKKTLFDKYIKGTLIEYVRQQVDDENSIEKHVDEAKSAFCN